jgi:hypothetical protein
MGSHDQPGSVVKVDEIPFVRGVSAAARLVALLELGLDSAIKEAWPLEQSRLQVTSRWKSGIRYLRRTDARFKDLRLRTAARSEPEDNRAVYIWLETTGDPR